MRAIVIPVEMDKGLTEIDVETAFPALKDVVGGWIERVSTPELHSLESRWGC
jgi:hypothetical protein